MIHRITQLFLGIATLLAVAGCGEEQVKYARTSGFEDFVPQYNRYIRNWLLEQEKATKEELREAERSMQSVEGDERNAVEKKLVALKRDEEKWSFRLGLGDYFRYADPSEIPADLAWQNGMDEEEIGDPAAKKGGTFNTFILTFPPTIRPFGDNSNNGFRGTLYDEIDMPLVGLHPKSMEMIPGIANEWAVSADGRTAYFRIDPEARYSDGEPVRAGDYLFASYLRISDDIVNPYAKQYWKEEIAGFTVYDERTLSISLPEAKLFAPAISGGLTPSAPHFYTDYGPDFTERHQWRFPPTTGAYEVLPDDVVKGVSVTQTRVKDWWAKDRKYYRHRFNPDRIRHIVVRDESKAFELFRAGELDTFYLTRPNFWYEKSEVEPVFNGFIERYTFYTRYPALPRGIYMNVAKPLLEERDVRIGIQHAMHWQKVIDVIFRGDYQRLDAFNQGYLQFSDPTIRAIPYSVSKARAAFARAGFTETGRDGILRRPDGTKLSISVSYPSTPPLYGQMFAILREEARACGFDLRLDSNEPTVDYKKSMLKQYEMTYSGWMISPPVPDYYQFMHSSNARDEKGNIKPQTNNLWVWARDDTDMLSETVRNARTVEEMRDASVELQHIIHDEAIFVPSYTVDFFRVGSWRWVQWPDSEETRFCPPVIYEPLEVHVHWIDEEIKEQTMEARREGKTFEEVNRIIDDYRYTVTKPETASAPEPEDEPGDVAVPTEILPEEEVPE